MCAWLSVWAFVEAWNNFCLYTRGQWIEAQIIAVREDTDGDGAPRFYPEVAFTPPDSEEVRVKSKVGRLIRSTVRSGYASGTTSQAPASPSGGLRRAWSVRLPMGLRL
ncbi:hypothetical protein SCNRRL3882_5009 [Streptomyces chartreusis NRRL 3882]|uniref:Uncharacterized protein n=1 Tax=Streptomyces chartreusis NRRL 3882 TaxID=1079985 RepID=A0A2N9BE05_STRCX|nr:hypothetical protein SCNRRL3882_5009 [Streptomyces chartreusis NRRL 3882]